MKNIIYYGTKTPLPEKISLRAGPLSMIYEAGDLRYIKFGNQEILRRIYAAVRDHNWNTIPMTLDEVQMNINERTFHISYLAHHQWANIDFVWRGTIRGEEDGTIVFQFDGESRSTFKRNRIGFCVLHPAECAGQRCTVEHVDGTQDQGRFPHYIQPHQPFKNMKAITHEVLPGLHAEVRFDGDIFEMEDQRNWTDASFKTYCTPQERPSPVEVKTGTRITQSVTFKLHGTIPPISVTDQELSFHLTEQTTPLPHIGLGIASHGEPLTMTEINRLKALKVSHLRVDLGPDTMEVSLRQAIEQATQLDIGLELAINTPTENDLKRLRTLLDASQAPIISFLLLPDRPNDPTLYELARQYLGDYSDSVLIGGGTNGNFTELNRQRPPTSTIDIVCYSINPQVHAFDNSSLTETLAMHQMTVESARQFVDGRPIAVTPITLKPRFSPNPTDELPPQVDVRQMSLYGACWTTGSLKYIAQSSAFSVTYYETTGWRGVMEQEKGNPQPDKFHSVPGGVFPLYHILADVGEFAGGEIIHIVSSDPLTVDGLVVRKNDRSRLILANFTPTSQRVTLPVTGQVTHLDETTYELAVKNPSDFRSQPGQALAVPEVELLPFATVRLDF